MDTKTTIITKGFNEKEEQERQKLEKKMHNITMRAHELLGGISNIFVVLLHVTCEAIHLSDGRSTLSHRTIFRIVFDYGAHCGSDYERRDKFEVEAIWRPLERWTEGSETSIVPRLEKVNGHINPPGSYRIWFLDQSNNSLAEALVSFSQEVLTRYWNFLDEKALRIRDMVNKDFAPLGKGVYKQ